MLYALRRGNQAGIENVGVSLFAGAFVAFFENTLHALAGLPFRALFALLEDLLQPLHVLLCLFQVGLKGLFQLVIACRLDQLGQGPGDLGFSRIEIFQLLDQEFA